MKYLIFLDIDGTILSEHGIHPRTVAAIEEAQQHGHLVFINTGRSYGIVPPIVMDTVHWTGFVCGLGAWIQHGDTVLQREHLTNKQCQFIMDIADKYNNPVILEGEVESVSYGDFAYIGNEHRVYSLSEMLERYPDIRITKLTFFKRFPEEAVAALSEQFEVFNHPHYAEVGVKGKSKATGMEYLMEYFGIDRDHVIAMGDSNNDVQMLEAAGTSVVMANGLDEIKKLADFITLDCREGGVGYAIEELILKKDRES